jgi:hypothetical protein
MLKNFLKVSLVVGAAVAALSLQASAQTVQLNALGSSAFFLESGLGANYSKGAINAPCVWSENTSIVFATDTSVTPSAVDKGNAWVAWTKGTGTCAAPAGTYNIYSYLQTDSVVGNRCLFNGAKCKITNNGSGVAPAGLILTGGVANCGTTGECALPAAVATALNAAAVNAAGTDIRPEDAEFAIARALTPCGTAIAGTQYLGLGYANGGVINSAISTKTFNVVNFSLPASYSVTTVGATAIVFAYHTDGSTGGFQKGNLTSAQVAHYLDGTTNTTNATASPKAANVLLREPLSGTYNTTEYNVPNTTVNQTSQDVGKNQLAAQRACSGTADLNPLKFVAANGGTRLRAIGTGEEVAQIGAYANAGGGTNNFGYSFWSVANFAGLGALANTGYFTVDGVDPLNKTSCTYSGAIPVTGNASLSCVDMHTVGNGTYPAWSLLRLVNAGSTPLAAVTQLASAAQAFVSFGTTTSRPDFIVPASMTVVRSHFLPPAGVGLPTAIANGDSKLGSGRTACTATESNGDVGGVVITLTADSAYCTAHGVTTGETGMRR